MTLSQSYNSNSNQSKIIRTPENQEEYSKDYKKFWLNIGLKPNENREDTQLSFLLETLEKEIDTKKVETVLEIGVGYGRIAKGILDAFPKIGTYIGIDLSVRAMEECFEYLKGYDNFSGTAPLDFEEHNAGEVFFDMVISVETMSCLPAGYNVHKWINKMVSLSKKYVINLDYTQDGGYIFDNPHDYTHLYKSNKDVRALGNVDVGDQSIFIAYIR